MTRPEAVHLVRERWERLGIGTPEEFPHVFSSDVDNMLAWANLPDVNEAINQAAHQVTETALVAVRCPTHKIGMVPRPLHRQSKEQIWCGAWWDCPEHKCGCSTLFQSPELRAQLAEMQRAAKAGRA